MAPATTREKEAAWMALAVEFQPVIYVVTGHYTSVKFHWGLIVDQSLTSVGEMYFIANWR